MKAKVSGAFTLLFLQLGTLYAWGVFQAELANQKLGNSVVLSTIGGVSGFCTALGCLPVSLKVSVGAAKRRDPSLSLVSGHVKLLSARSFSLRFPCYCQAFSHAV
jgi:hypothetical protein